MSVPLAPDIAVVGAGPVGLALALHAAQALPAARITLFDARSAGHDVSGDGRTVALALGSVQLLRRLGVWPAAAQPIVEVRVSQQPPSGLPGLSEPELRIRAVDEGVPMLGAVLSYGELVAALQRAWFARAAAEPERLRSRFGQPVSALRDGTPGGVEVEAGAVAERFELAVIAEGSVFADAARKALHHDYRQTAWVGSVALDGGEPGVAVERFTRHGPAALLPLRSGRAALVWCVGSDDDPVRELNDAQRVAVLNHVFPPSIGRIVEAGALKAFPLALAAETTLVRRAGGASGRVVRIGNAAQTLHPVAGQGLNLGLRDAYALVLALRDSADVDRALRRVEWGRAGDRWSMIGATDFLARSFTWRLPGLGAARGLALAALQRLAPARSLLARQMMYGRR